ncbi:hypothetical protein [Streptomyces sp. KLOTTS4A1]|uniref:hypothetical protein n=1 Tax=Streptomyces sp. KLOTTS4A1 TaxID=3390996 RepID=UPI0039F589CD
MADVTEEGAPEASAPEASGPEASRAGERAEMVRKADRLGVWSTAWLILSLLLWAWFTVLMVGDYGALRGYGDYRAECRGPLVELARAGSTCAEDSWHQWPAALGMLALAVLSTILAAATIVYGKVLTRITTLVPAAEATGPRPGDPAP